MVLILDGNSDHVAHASRKIDLTALDLIKCLKQILLLTCDP